MRRAEIQAETDRETGSNKGISDKQIRLKISSPYVLTMTLVDLPGICRVPVGDQPIDIEARERAGRGGRAAGSRPPSQARIADMIFSYIRRESCLILAVTPANSDLAASDAIKLARQVDPQGLRTLGVITKVRQLAARCPRLVNAHSARAAGHHGPRHERGVLHPRRRHPPPARLHRCVSSRQRARGLSLTHLLLGVVNRCQEDIMHKRSIREALASEAAFFQSHPEYAAVANRCSTSALSHSVSSILSQHIANLLPGLAQSIGAPPSLALLRSRQLTLPAPQ